MRPLREWVLELAILLAVTLVVAAMGPFGSFELGDYASRFLYWATMLFGGYLVLRPLLAAGPWLARRLDLPELPVWLGLMALAGLPVTLIVWFGGGATGMPRPDQFLRLYPNILILGGIVTLVFWASFRRRPLPSPPVPAAGPSPSAHPAPPVPEAATGAPPRLLERLPPHARGRIRALEMEDHYVRIHTDRSAPLLLMRMRDAVAELDGLPGEQVHRSWWVARDAVRHHETDGRSIRLHLEGELVAPVARANIPALRAKGWF
ncbi:MAG: LytTR family DNA-binding domain-containing protein [Sphingomonadaceae bacterium]